MKICDRCHATVHDLETYKRSDGSRYDLCVTCELDRQTVMMGIQEEFDRLRNDAYEKQLQIFMATGPDKSDSGKNHE